jgi:hypothetical protein
MLLKGVSVRSACLLVLALAFSTPTLAEPISILNNVLCNGINARLDRDLTTVVCAVNLVINNTRITSATDITLKADGTITLNDESLDAPSINVLAGGSVSFNEGTTLNSSPRPEAGRLVIRGILSDSVISLANVLTRDPKLSIQLINTQKLQLCRLQALSFYCFVCSL